MRRKFVWVCGVFVCVMTGLHGAAFSNGVVMGGRLSDLIPLESKNIRMESEDILMEAEGAGLSGRWKVTADYVFVNLSGRDFKT